MSTLPSTPSLNEMYEPARRSRAWDLAQTELVRFWTDDGNCFGFIYHHLTATHYNAGVQRLFVDWALGTLVIAGPKVLEFYDDFSDHRVSVLRPDGDDITSVTMQLRQEDDDAIEEF
jgi:hypothetical protein